LGVITIYNYFYSFFITTTLHYIFGISIKKEVTMTFIYGLSGLLAFALFIYLLVVLFYPEKF